MQRDHAPFQAGAEQLREVCYAKLFHHVKAVDFHRAGADFQYLSDFSGRLAFPNERENLLLARRERNGLTLGRCGA